MGKRADWRMEKRAEWLALGRCGNCGGKKREQRWKFCEGCRAYYRPRSAAWREENYVPSDTPRAPRGLAYPRIVQLLKRRPGLTGKEIGQRLRLGKGVYVQLQRMRSHRLAKGVMVEGTRRWYA